MATKQKAVPMCVTGFTILDDYTDPMTMFGEWGESEAKGEVKDYLNMRYSADEFPDNNDIQVILFNHETGETKMIKVIPPKPLEFEDF